jgi:hypothetical protein
LLCNDDKADLTSGSGFVLSMLLAALLASKVSLLKEDSPSNGVSGLEVSWFVVDVVEDRMSSLSDDLCAITFRSPSIARRRSWITSSCFSLGFLEIRS